MKLGLFYKSNMKICQQITYPVMSTAHGGHLNLKSQTRQRKRYTVITLVTIPLVCEGDLGFVCTHNLNVYKCSLTETFNKHYAEVKKKRYP